MDMLAPQAQLVLDDAAALDTTDDVLEANANAGQPPVLRFGLQ